MEIHGAPGALQPAFVEAGAELKKLLFILLLWPSLAIAGGPKYTYPSPPSPQGLDDEMNNVYHSISYPTINNGTASTMTITSLSVSTMTVSSATITSLTVTNLTTFFDRGDPSAYDKSSGWTTSGAWTTLDLSSVIPAGATAALIDLQFSTTNAGGGDLFSLRRNGNSNAVNESNLYMQIPNKLVGGDFVVSLDSNRIIQYSFTLAGSLDNAYLVVRGWWK